MEEWFVLVNPAAGGFKAEKLWPQIAESLRRAGIRFQFGISKNTGDAIAISSDAVLNGFRKLIAVGGDGTMNLLINGIFRQDKIDTKLITVGIIPVGTGNDWIRTHGIPKSTDAAIALLKNEKTIFHDAGKIKISTGGAVELRYFINMCGFGFEGFVAERIERVSSKIKKGPLAFVMGILVALFKYHETGMVIKLDGQRIEGPIFSVSAGICKYCGGGMKLTPGALCNDGLLDITVVAKISKAEVVINVPNLFNGSFIKNKKVSQYRTKRISILSDPLVPVECDGEVMGNGNVEIEILEKAIQAIVA